MRYTPGHKEKTRARILEAAGRVFRRLGYHAAGVDTVMEEAGLTAGGFYAHFASKQALLAEALPRTGAEARAGIEEGLEGLSGRDWIRAFLGRYLSPGHRLAPEGGCPLVALVSEVARADEDARRSFEAMVLDLTSTLASHAQEGGAEPGRADGGALAAIALCVGGLGLARAVHDEGLAGRILESCREEAIAILGGEPAPAPSVVGERKGG